MRACMRVCVHVFECVHACECVLAWARGATEAVRPSSHTAPREYSDTFEGVLRISRVPERSQSDRPPVQMLGDARAK
eukprot:11337550-Alexandrium_andersonii.AAC.1